MKTKFLLYSLFLILCGCSLAPNYHVPEVCIPVHYKESGKWFKPTTRLAKIDYIPWWEIYHDPELNKLEQQIECFNQNLKAALARYEQARAQVCIARSDLFPTLQGELNANRVKSSSTIALPFRPLLFNDYVAAANLTYEVDLWGKVRNAVVNARSLARASAADYAAIDLSLHAELATDYFLLRGRDNAQFILDETVQAYQRALELVRHRHKDGLVPAADLYQAENQLEVAKTAAADNHIKRDQLEHAIAILTGVPPACFSISIIKHWKIPFVSIATSLPSELLQRRPDITEYEEYVRAANANIGVARAAFFPDINLGCGIGYESDILSKLFKAPSLIWALGPLSNLRGLGTLNNNPLVLQTLLDGGKLQGGVNLALGSYWETVANYRQTVLTAFQEVEDSLVALRQLDKETITQRAATYAAEKSLQQSWYQYRGGLTTYLDVVVVQNIALQSELNLVNVYTARHLSSVNLIKALGGGWKNCNVCNRSA